MQHKNFQAKVRVYSVEGRDFLLYKFKGRYYPILITQESEECDEHIYPCPYKAAMVAQNQYAPFFSKQLKEIDKKTFKLEAVFSL